jgi:hypothetical protein
MWNRYSLQRASAGQFARLQAALSHILGRKAMLTSKICREHASKCNRVAETIPRGAQREMFLDMAKRWIDLAINIESTEALINPTSPANDPREPYRFDSACEGPNQLRPPGGSQRPSMRSGPVCMRRGVSDAQKIACYHEG